VQVGRIKDDHGGWNTGGVTCIDEGGRQQAAAAAERSKPFLCPLPAARCPGCGLLSRSSSSSPPWRSFRFLLLAISGARRRDPRDDRAGGARISSMLSSADAADQIADDLHVAMNFTERTSTPWRLTCLRARAGAEPVRYAWDGTSGHRSTTVHARASPALTAANATYTPLHCCRRDQPQSELHASHDGTAARRNGVAYSHDSTLLGSWRPRASTAHTGFTIRSDPACRWTDDVFNLAHLIYGRRRLTAWCRADLHTQQFQTGTLIEAEPLNSSALSTANEYAEVPFTASPIAAKPACASCSDKGRHSTVANFQYESALLSILSAGSGQHPATGPPGLHVRHEVFAIVCPTEHSNER